MGLVLSQQPTADALLDRDPLALLIGMVLDQQIALERAFSSPYDLTQRLGHDLDAAELADYDPDALAAIFATPPALHRFPKAMARRVQEVCRLVVDRYDGDTAAIWTTAPDGAELLRRVAALPGFGKHKAQIFVALLGKQYGVQPPGWDAAAGPFGVPGSYMSVADIVDGPSLLRVREYKQQMKAAAKAVAASTPAATSTPAAGTTATRGAKATPARSAKATLARAGAKAAAKTPAKTPAKAAAKAPAKAPAKTAGKAPAKTVRVGAKAPAKAPAKTAGKAPAKTVRVGAKAAAKVPAKSAVKATPARSGAKAAAKAPAKTVKV